MYVCVCVCMYVCIYMHPAALTDAGEDEQDHEGVEHRHDGQGQGREDLHYYIILYYIILYYIIYIITLQYRKELSTGTMAKARAVRIW